MTQTNNEREAFELAVVNNLGKEALLKENLSPLEIFERGWNARAQSPISKNERQQVIGFIDEADDGIFGDVQKGIAEGLCKVGDLLYASPPKQIHDGWKPIETVPKDGTQVIIKCSGERVATAFYDDKPFVGEGWHVVVPFLGGFGSGTDTFIYFQEDMPTHWMPLPTPTTSLTSETNTEVGND